MKPDSGLLNAKFLLLAPKRFQVENNHFRKALEAMNKERKKAQFYFDSLLHKWAKHGPCMLASVLFTSSQQAEIH